MSRTHPTITAIVAPSAADPTGLTEAGKATVHVVRDATELDAVIDATDVLAVYDFRTKLVEHLGARAGELDWIHAASAGVDAVLTPAVVAGPTLVTNAQGVFDDAIAEFVLAVLLVFAKDLRTTFALQQQHTWRHRETERLAGRQVVVVGAGSIGRSISRLCRTTGMSVRGVARRSRSEDPDFDAVVSVDQLHTELAAADDVVLATPLTADTHRLIDRAAFAAMRPGTRLVNIGRGPVVDHDALLEALRSGRVGAAALDVFDEEPLPADHPFWDMDQVIVSPHMSGDVVGWIDALGAQFLANLDRWKAGEPLHHTVDKHALSGATP